ncbi:MAG: EamA family transporter, partial [bacterium]
MQKEKTGIYPLLATGVFVISFSGIFIRLAEAPSLIIAFYRMFYSILFLTPVFIYKYRDNFEYFLDYRPLIVGFFLAVHFFLWITAFEYTDVGNAVIFIALQPLFTYILEYLFAKEDLKEGVLLGILLALIGSIIISIGDLAVLVDKLWGDLLALMAAFFAACYLFSGRSLRKEIKYFPYIFLVYTYATLFMGLFILVRGIPFTGYSSQNYLY